MTRPIDKVLLHAAALVVFICVMILGNRWVVAQAQVEALATMMAEQSLAAMAHVVRPGPVPANPASWAADTLTLSPHHLAVVVLDAQGAVLATAAQGVPLAAPQRTALQQPGRWDAPLYLGRDGAPMPLSRWAWLPAQQVLEVPGASGWRLRVLLSLQVPREQQRELAQHAVLSTTLLLALVAVFLGWVLRRPRVALDEAAAYAAQLAVASPPRLSDQPSHIVAVDDLRASLNGLSDVLRAQRERQRNDEAALIAAAEAARAAAEVKGQFLANMSHEIRTPLNGMIGITQLLLGTELTPQQRHFLQLASQSSHQLLMVVNDVLDLSKIEAGRMTLESVAYSPHQLIDEVLPLFAVRAAEKGLVLLNHASPSLPVTVLGDPLRLRQVLGNLLGNAVKFTREGHVALRVHAEPVHGQLQQVRLVFEVSDTGPGIALEQREAVLEAFGQADATIARQHGGTGLGLTISSALLGLMGSRLHIDGRPGHGSVFRFALVGEWRGGVAGQQMPEWLSWAGQTLLWVDPLAASRQWSAGVLVGWHAEVRTAASLGAAVAALAAATAPTPQWLVVSAALRTAEGDAALQRLVHAAPGARKVLLLGPFDTLPPALADAGWLGVMTPLSLRALNALSPAAPDADPAQPSSRSGALALHGLRVLLAEDNEVNALVAVSALELHGAVVTHAQDGEAALRLALKGGQDIVLMDLQMPGMDGHAACAALRRHEAERGLPRLPVVAMTAHLLNEERRRMHASGMDGYISKPFEWSTLVAEINRVLASDAEDNGFPLTQF